MTAPIPSLLFDGTVHAGGQRILGPARAEIPAGRWTCLLGPSGVGKSTLLHCFANMSNEFVLTGRAEATDGVALTGRVALMAQTDLLMPWLGLRENVVLGARLRGAPADLSRADDLIAAVGLADLAGRRPSALSGGQRQRAALARTLFEDRPVILLDEPFSALDVANRVRMQDLAARCLAGRTVLHVTHDPGEAARLGETILVLTRDGITRVPAPDTRIPRPPDAPDTLAATGALTRLLLEAA